jgi:hypothetical protein
MIRWKHRIRMFLNPLIKEAMPGSVHFGFRDDCIGGDTSPEATNGASRTHNGFLSGRGVR